MKGKTNLHLKKNIASQRTKVSIMLKESRIRMVMTHQINHYKYNKNVINSIIYNEKDHIVAEFKDYLIFDDFSEFLKRFYRLNESIIRLPNINEFYDNYSKIFPNYTNIPEAKYMYKNIKRKQKVINNNQQKHGDSLDEENFRVINTEAYDSIMNQTQKTCEDRMLRVDESAQSLEGIIDTIGKAEKNAVIMLTKKMANNNTKNLTTCYNIANINSLGTKNNYNFHLDLDNLNAMNLKENLIKNETKQSSNNKIIINHIDDIQKLQLKLNAGVIKSERNSISKAIEAENDMKKRNAKTPKTELNEAGNCAIHLKASNKNIKEYHNFLKNTKSARNSKNLEFIDLLSQEYLNLHSKQIKTANIKDKIIYEEESLSKVTETKLLQGKKNKEDLKPYHKSTISMPKLPSSTIYNNYNIINNFQNIILPNEPIANNNSQLKSVLENKSTSNNIKNVSSKNVKNFSKDLHKIKQNLKKILNGYNTPGTNNSKEKLTIFNKIDAKKKVERSYPLSARNERDNDFINMKKILKKDKIEDQIDTNHLKFEAKKIERQVTTL